MKKLMMIIAMLGFIAIGKVGTVMAQEIPEDSLSIDDMAPIFYEAQEEEESANNSSTAVIIVVAIVVIGGGAYYFTKKKK